MTTPRAGWDIGDLDDRDRAVWEAAERAADSAPEITRGSDVAMRLQQLYADFPEVLRERARHDPAA